MLVLLSLSVKADFLGDTVNMGNSIASNPIIQSFTDAITHLNAEQIAKIIPAFLLLLVALRVKIFVNFFQSISLFAAIAIIMYIGAVIMGIL